MSNSLRHNFPTIIQLIAVLCILLPPTILRPPLEDISSHYLSEAEYLKTINECTTGVASGSATPDGRPLLWKNRDIGNRDQEYHYVDDGRIPFIGLTYAGVTLKYFAGLNEAGFAVENSFVHNLDYTSGFDAGYIMKLALATCRTVDDFQAILDSTDETGRRDNNNYGVIDAFGGAAYFEAAREEYTRFDAAETDDGFLIRCNFALTGNEEEISDANGLHRYERANQIWKHGVEQGVLTPEYIYRNAVRDLYQPGFDPYPLGFDGYYQDYPFGCLPNDLVICRSTTQSVMIAHGVAADENPADALIWAMVGSPLSCVATPLWVRAGSVPTEYDGERTSEISDEADRIRDYINVSFNWRTLVDTWRLIDSYGTGFWDFGLPYEARMFAKTEQFLNSPNFSYDRLETFQNEFAEQAADSLRAWHPSFALIESLEPIYEEDNLRLVWSDGRFGFPGRDAPRNGYDVYRSAEPFRSNEAGELLGHVEENFYVDENPPAGGAFYRVLVLFE